METSAVLPIVTIDNVPLTDAIRALTRMAGVNHILDPHLSDSDKDLLVNVRWTNITAESAADKLFKIHRLQGVYSPATKVMRVASAKENIQPVRTNNVFSATNDLIPVLAVKGIALNELIRSLSVRARIKVVMDPEMLLPASGSPGKKLRECEVSLHWENLTAGQAMAALLDNYDLMLVPNSDRSSYTVKPKEAAKPSSR
jgi:hypothetical protein